MKTIISAIFIAAIATIPAHAALPPQYQRQAEFVAVLNAATEVLGVQHIIDTIELTEPDLYVVTSGNCTLAVRIKDVASNGGTMMVGPRQFEAQPEEIICATGQ
ncbi:hypothetical protein JHL21_11770 [Devosia sp. WQ 349]|uniref:hypothetical protein n=1 Tax=Devosia sp. WQ 349K1 TaxID=2800329 RepID=UPI00190705B6|nr:hypothetical protein [Devosia sp. WQ 349K1]MBK1795175.1 hypothetical protein [Devosia sp. WQ 349K1]